MVRVCESESISPFVRQAVSSVEILLWLAINWASNVNLFSEYIVSYKGYYKQLTRKRYLNAALYESGVTSWKIVQRDNPAFDYPSDFDVVKVRLYL